MKKLLFAVLFVILVIATAGHYYTERVAQSKSVPLNTLCQRMVDAGLETDVATCIKYTQR